MIERIEQNTKLKKVLIAPLLIIPTIFAVVFLYTFGKGVGQILYEIVNNIVC